MSKRNLKGLLIKADIEGNKIETKVMETSELRDFYKMLECSVIAITDRKIGDKSYNIVCDDEGLLKEERIPTFCSVNKEGLVNEFIVGNIFICNNEGEELIDLTDEDIKEILCHQTGFLTQNFQRIAPVIQGSY